MYSAYVLKLNAPLHMYWNSMHSPCAFVLSAPVHVYCIDTQCMCTDTQSTVHVY